MLLLALKMVLKMHLQMVNDGVITIHRISWTYLENLVVDSMGYKRQHVSDLRQELFIDGEILVFGESDASKRGPKIEDSRRILNRNELLDIVSYVDMCHSKGEPVTNRKMREYVEDKFFKTVSRSTMGRYFALMGLSWKKIKNKKRRVGDYRLDLIRIYIIDFNNYYSIWLDEGLDGDYIFVCTDESYIHQNHMCGSSYYLEEKKDDAGTKNQMQTTSRGNRLIMLHAITPYGPICERINSKPVDDLVWKGDTPHSTPRQDGKMTAELLWKASSSTGDYHDNMCSDMFMRWIEQKLVPTFEKNYEGKKMVLIMDNAPYHHKREVGSLAKANKQELVDLMKKHNIEYIDVPTTLSRFELCDTFDQDNNVIAQDKEEYCRLFFNEKNFLARATNKNAAIPTVDEMKLGIVKYLQEVKPEVMSCKVEEYLNKRGHKILWTPPYCCQLQPIELFWAAGKNHAGRLTYKGIKMKDTVQNVREGWYGSEVYKPTTNQSQPLPYKERIKKPADCLGMFMHAVKEANERFIPLCDGISGTIGSLIIDESHKTNLIGLPIDLLINDITKQESFEEAII